MGFEGPAAVGAIFTASMHRAPTPTHAHNHWVRLASTENVYNFLKIITTKEAWGCPGVNPGSLGNQKVGTAHG